MVKFKTECKFVFQIESSLGTSQVAQWVKKLSARQAEGAFDSGGQDGTWVLIYI
mgnify:CR=1 FL=1